MEIRPKRKFAVRAVLAVFFAHAKRYPKAVSSGMLFVAIAIFIDIIVPLYYKRMIDLAAAAPGPSAAVGDAMVAVLIIAMSLFFLRQLTRRLGSIANTYFQPRIMNDLVQTSFSYMLGHSYSFFVNNFSGSLVRRINRITRAFEDVADRVQDNIIPLVITLTGVTVVLFTRNIILGSIFLGWVILFTIVQFAIARWKMRFDIDVAAQDSVVTGVLSDSIGNNVTAKLFAGENVERELVKEASDEQQRMRLKSWTVNEIINGIQAALMIIVEFLLMYAGIRLWQRGLLTVGDFVLIQSYVIAAVDRLWNLGSSIRKLYESFADATEMVDILNERHEISDAPNAKALIVTAGAIDFRDVQFRFHEERTVLDGFNLNIPAHEKVALVGPSGAGKTTITKLVVRFHDVNEGGIYIDGQNIKEVTQESLRNAIAFVPQEPVLFHRSLMENIRYGRRDATDAEVIEASKQAHCYDFIMATPQGFETYVGERGIKLSGGERQRVAIARAILKNAPILILDEATSSLDSESEALIQDALSRLMQGKTVIAIAHRLSTVMKMDRIVVIESGKVAMTGTHDELLTHGGLYKKLWEIQAGGFIENDLGEKFEAQ